MVKRRYTCPTRQRVGEDAANAVGNAVAKQHGATYHMAGGRL